MKKTIIKTVLILFLFCFWLSCDNAKNTSTSSTFVDDVQQTHTFKTPPERIISLVPSITEILYEIGAEDKIIAVTEHCNYPEKVKQHQKKLVVYPNVSTEQVLALKPDIILTSTEVMSVKIIEQFKPYRIPVFFVNYQTVKDIPRTIRLLGSIVNLKSRATLVADSLEKIIEYHTQLKPIKRPKIWLVIGTQPMYTAGKNSFMNDIIHLAGGENIAESITNTAYPILTREFVLSQRPEYIIVSQSEKNKVKEKLLSLYPEMKLLSCLQDSTRIIGIEEDILVRPTVRSTQAINQIKKEIDKNQ